MGYRRYEDASDSTPSPPSWYTYVIIASLAGGGGGFLGSITDPIKNDPTARPDPYTGSMAKADLAARDYRIDQLDKRVDKGVAVCEALHDQVSRLEREVWRLQEGFKAKHP